MTGNRAVVGNRTIVTGGPCLLIAVPCSVRRIGVRFSRPPRAPPSCLRRILIVLFLRLRLRPGDRPFVERLEGLTERCPQASELVAVG